MILLGRDDYLGYFDSSKGKGMSGSTSQTLGEGEIIELLQAGDMLEESKSRLEEYMETFDFDQDHFERLKARLEEVNRVLKEYECRTVSELLAEAQRTSDALEQWAQLSGVLLSRRKLYRMTCKYSHESVFQH